MLAGVLSCPLMLVGKSTAAMPPDAKADAATIATRVRRLEITQDPNHHAVVTPEILSTSWNTDQSVRVTAVLINDAGIAVAGGSDTDSFRTYGEPVIAGDARVVLLHSDRVSGSSVLIGHRSIVTGMPMGSTWGRFMNIDPIFQPDTLLSSKFALVRQVGFRQLYVDQWRDIQRQFERRARGSSDRRVIDALARYRSSLAFVLSGQHGDSDETLAIACRLAGFSENRDFVAPLRSLLNHDSAIVRDSAAIGLGLLGANDAVDRLRELAADGEPTTDSSSNPLHIRAGEEARLALDR